MGVEAIFLLTISAFLCGVIVGKRESKPTGEWLEVTTDADSMKVLKAAMTSKVGFIFVHRND
jgi:hypothetical protein